MGQRNYGLLLSDCSAVVEQRMQRRPQLAEHADDGLDASMMAPEGYTGAGERRRGRLGAWCEIDLWK